MNIGQALIIGSGLTIVLAMAGQGVIAGVMTVGDFVLVNTYLIQVYMPLNFLGFVYREIKQSLTDMEVMFQLMYVNTEIQDAEGAPPLADGPGQVEFDDVSFMYDARRPILKHVSFRVPAGRKVAIVGSSGVGKSTIARLFFRFYDVSYGSIRIDGHDTRHVRQRSVRDAFGVVPRDAVLFNDTIRYDIAYGRPEATAKDVEQAARLAQIREFISNSPDG